MHSKVMINSQNILRVDFTSITKKKEGRKEPVIQKSLMFIGAHSPARSDQMKKWSESKAAVPKGRCPVGHRGEFRGGFEVGMAEFSPKEQI